MHEVSRLMLRGSYGFSAELGCEVFMLDPACDLEFFKMPNGMTAVVVDVRAGLDAAVVAHDECVDMAIGKAKLLIALEEDEFANVEVIDEDDDDDEENNYSTLRRRMNIDRNE